jgi:intracellular sulfur oxidation DsrE/DsrF family protein
LNTVIAGAATCPPQQGMEKAEGKQVSVVPDATIVPSGVVRIMELQEQGWSYVLP